MTHSPLLGFNNNVKHRGRLFHIQTEDSGIRHPHVITHLFMDGGRILKTVKTSYAEHIGNEQLEQLVRELMKEQHKTMFIALRDGKFDHVLEASSPSGGPTSRSSLPVGGAPRTATSSLPAAAAASRITASELAAALPRSVPPSVNEPKVAGPASRTTDPPTGVRPVQRREAPEFFAGRPSEGAVVNVVEEQREGGTAAAAKAEPKEQPGSGRYVAPRPAAIFVSARNPEAGGSIFGDDLISEKSLDEVILSYLSDDLDSSSSKK
jgi:hypothetical protein